MVQKKFDASRRLQEMANEPRGHKVGHTIGVGICGGCLKENTLIVKPGTQTMICYICRWEPKP